AFQDQPLEPQLAMIDLNVRALVHLTYLCLPYMQPGDRILQIASSAGLLPMENFSVYSASKAFVIHFSNGLAAELSRKGIIVTAVCPGPVKTEFHQVATNGKSDRTSLPMATPEQVVTKALHDADRRKWMSLYGLPIKLLPVVTRLFSRKFLTGVAGRF
ncbi:MAG TPA: SDR family NAD(P)-dependent oxidoreductase, partial [bacterium]|nr:SDR family NAD(P)-dependent oxidoreductase [bacterium]